MDVLNKLIRSFNEMSELTSPICAKECRAPHSCCSPEYCDMAESRAKEFNIELMRTSHPTLKFMGESGCTVPPYLRPLCTLHVCCINGLGFRPNQEEWTKKYYKLRARINKLEFELSNTKGGK